VASLSTNYIGRISDIDIFGIDDEPTLQDVALGFGSGSVIAGPYKEAQKFLRILLSDRGTLLGQPTYGTDFFTKLTQGTILNEAQFELFFTSAKAKALGFMYAAKLKEGVSDSRFKDDEIIKDVDLYSAVITPGEVKATFKFIFRDNDAGIIIPVGIPVGI